MVNVHQFITVALLDDAAGVIGLGIHAHRSGGDTHNETRLVPGLLGGEGTKSQAAQTEGGQLDKFTAGVSFVHGVGIIPKMSGCCAAAAFRAGDVAQALGLASKIEP